jgi:hypothetical protein
MVRVDIVANRREQMRRESKENNKYMMLGIEDLRSLDTQRRTSINDIVNRAILSRQNGLTPEDRKDVEHILHQLNVITLIIAKKNLQKGKLIELNSKLIEVKELEDKLEKKLKRERVL